MAQKIVNISPQDYQDFLAFKAMKAKNQRKVAVKGNKYTEWYKEKGLRIVKHTTHTHKGKKYPAVVFDNGRTAVYWRNGTFLKYLKA